MGKTKNVGFKRLSKFSLITVILLLRQSYVIFVERHTYRVRHH